MARRHEDRRSGERLQRGARGPGGQGGGSGRGGRRGQPGQRRGPTSRRARGVQVTPLPGPERQSDGKLRLNRCLAMAGVCSRRAADEVIQSGRVEVNGKTVTELGVRIDPVADEVRVDGRRLQPEKPVYLLFNKPKGVVCTNARFEQKQRVIDLLPDVRGRIYTVGRLDLDSEGLILLTNDGDFALQMTHPRYGVPKIYAVLVRGRVVAEDLKRARGGVWLAEGPTTGLNIKIERSSPGRTYMKVQIREGKNREIRRVFAKLGYPVTSLKRVRIGELTLHGLGEGKWRFLTAAEVRHLLAIAQQEHAVAGASE